MKSCSGSWAKRLSVQHKTGIQVVVNFWLFHNSFNISIGIGISDSGMIRITQGTSYYITEHIGRKKQWGTGSISDEAQALAG